MFSDSEQVDRLKSDDDLLDAEDIVELSAAKAKRTRSDLSTSEEDLDVPPPPKKFATARVKKTNESNPETTRSFPQTTTTPSTSSTRGSTSTGPIDSYLVRKRRKIEHSPKPSPTKSRLLAVSSQQEYAPTALSRCMNNPLFLPGSSADENEYSAMRYDDEPFSLDPDVFDIEQPLSSFNPDLDAHEVPMDITPPEDPFTHHYDRQVSHNEHPYEMPPPIAEKFAPVPVYDDLEDYTDYDQGIAELQAWLNSGAVEIIE